jgi:hypothetical protein
VVTQITIPAGDSVVRHYVWTGGQSFVPPDPGQKLPPGVYFVSAVLTGRDFMSQAFPVKVRIAASQ